VNELGQQKQSSKTADLAEQLSQLTKQQPTLPGRKPVADTILSGIIGGLGENTDNIPGSPPSDKLIISAVTPRTGPAQTELFVDLIGTGFQRPMKISLGNRQITNFTIHSENLISLKAEPFANQSILDLIVEQSDKRYELPDAFTVTRAELKEPTCDSCDSATLLDLGCNL